jgi:coenzyme F420-0:L-glutamate ligase/coenzyme F420-1:gamma-L-glutamate ligase
MNFLYVAAGASVLALVFAFLKYGAIMKRDAPALWDRRGEFDLYGYQLQHTTVGVADEIAAAAGLLMGQASEGMPVVLIRGLQLPPIEGKAQDLVRPKVMDLYR